MADSTVHEMDSDDYEAHPHNIEIDVEWPGGNRAETFFGFYTNTGIPLTVAQALTVLLQGLGIVGVALETVTATIVRANDGNVTMNHEVMATEYSQHLSADNAYLQLRY